MFTEEGRFHANEWPTLGVEIELALVDSQSLALRSVAPRILERVPPSLQDEVKPEFMQCYVELTSRVCRTVDEIGADLASKLAVVEGVARDLGTRLLWSGTHPFSAWQDQEITPKARYFRLAQLLGETVVRPVTFGLHVHVGVSSGNAAIRAMNGLREYLPLLLALSANSPFWHGRTTGHHSHRIEVLEGFPTSGFPPRLQSWAEYADLIERLKTSGCIESNHELWWDARPNSQFGTVEVRICDMPPDLSTVLAITGLIQCLVC